MDNIFKQLKNKTDELEQKINEFISSSQKKTIANSFSSFSKNLSNLSIVDKRKIQIATVNATGSVNMHVQALIELSLATEQEISFSIIINNISIFKSTKILQSSFNQISLIFDYMPLTTEPIDIYLEINPIDKKEILLNNILLTVWGAEEIKDDYCYQIVTKSDKYILSFLENKTLYTLETNKVNGSYNVEDFSAFKAAKSYSFAYFSNPEKLYLFRVDTDGKLFFSNYSDKVETFILSNITQVSSATDNSKILINYIRNGNCFYMEFDGTTFSEERQIDSQGATVENTYTYYNSSANKFYVILTDKNQNNYLIESINETKSFGETISATVDLTITIRQEENNEVSLS